MGSVYSYQFVGMNVWTSELQCMNVPFIHQRYGSYIGVIIHWRAGSDSARMYDHSDVWMYQSAIIHRTLGVIIHRSRVLVYSSDVWLPSYAPMVASVGVFQVAEFVRIFDPTKMPFCTQFLKMSSLLKLFSYSNLHVALFSYYFGELRFLFHFFIHTKLLRYYHFKSKMDFISKFTVSFSRYRVSCVSLQ